MISQPLGHSVQNPVADNFSIFPGFPSGARATRHPPRTSTCKCVADATQQQGAGSLPLVPWLRGCVPSVRRCPAARAATDQALGSVSRLWPFRDLLFLWPSYFHRAHAAYRHSYKIIAAGSVTSITDYLSTSLISVDGDGRKFSWRSSDDLSEAIHTAAGLPPPLRYIGPECGRAGNAARPFECRTQAHVGANPKVAQQQMRHSDARITLEAYAHVIGNSQR